MKNSILFSALLASALPCGAVPAYPWPQTAKQPDGSEITYILRGDERGSMMLTTDGYLLTRDAAGVICYAQQGSDGSLKLLMPAHDRRSASEKNLLKAMGRAQATAPAPRQQYVPQKAVSSKDFRGLVILVNYSDRKLISYDTRNFYNEMINADDYRGYKDNDGNTVEITGSVRDYFRDNSGGQFVPEFDVYGPVELEVPFYFPMQMQNAEMLMSLSLKAADAEVDFSKYDSDGDGRVDMVYFIFAGEGSNYTGGKEIWPHKSDLHGIYLDGVEIGTYACSAELIGLPGQSEVDGVGTICHEFSHVLGMVDEYDTDYSGTGGEADHPDAWSLMSMGCYLNHGRTPVGYSAYERIMAGFITPEEIAVSGTYSLPALETSAKAMMIESMVGDEFFILENRQPVKWDKALPGHGMLLYRVDRTEPDLWTTNRVNQDPEHPRYAFLSAKPQYGGNMGRRQNTGYDPFPGLGNVTELTNSTSPSLQSWYGYNSNVTLHDIAEADGVITFRAEVTSNQTYSEKWSLLAQPDEQGACQGSIASWTTGAGAEIDRENSTVTFIKKSQVTSSPIAGKVNMVKFKARNATTASATFQLKYSLDGGNTWSTAKTIGGEDRVAVSKGSELAVSYSLEDIDPDTEADLQLRILEFSGLTDQRCSVSDLEFIMVPAPSAADGLLFVLPDNEYVDVTDPVCPVTFYYKGTSHVESVAYSWSAGSSSGTGEYAFVPVLEPSEAATQEVPLRLEGISDLGTHDLALELTAVNGTALSSPLGAMRPAEIRVIPFTPVTRPLVEEFTGLNCSACPKGYVFMETMHREQGDKFVGMAYHSETYERENGMVVLHNKEFPVTPYSLPSGSVSRTSVVSIDELRSAWNRAYMEMAPAAVEVTLTPVGEQPGLLHAEASAAFIEDADAEDYALSVVLVADNLSNPGWLQNNGYSGNTSGDYTGELWEIFTKGEPYVAGLTFNDVVVAYPDMDGIEGAFPALIEAGVAYSATLDFDVPAIRNIYGKEFISKDAKLRAVAIVTDRKSGRVVNACTSAPVGYGDSGITMPEAASGELVECFDLAGLRVSPATPGFQIRVYRLSDGTLRTVRHLNRR